MIPIRCFTCGKLIAHKWEQYCQETNNGTSRQDALEIIGFQRYCCRRMFLGHVDITDQLILMSNNNNRRSNNKTLSTLDM